MEEIIICLLLLIIIVLLLGFTHVLQKYQALKNVHFSNWRDWEENNKEYTKTGSDDGRSF